MLLSSTFFKEQHSVLQMDKGIAKQLCIYNNQHQSTIYSTYLYTFTAFQYVDMNQWKYITVYHLHILIEYKYSICQVGKKKPHVGFLPAVNPNHLQQSPAKKLKSCILPQTCHDTMCFADRQDQPWRTELGCLPVISEDVRW